MGMALPKVRVDPWFVIAVSVLSLLQVRGVAQTVALAAAYTATVLVHELGHAMVARRFGAGGMVVLNGLGGRTCLGVDNQFLGRGQRLQVLAAGPAAGLVLAALLYGADSLLWQERLSAPALFFHALAYLSLWMSILSLIPVVGLDGWGAAYILIRADVHEGRSLAITWVGVALAVAGVPLSLAVDQPVLAVLSAAQVLAGLHLLGMRRHREHGRKLDRALSTRDLEAVELLLARVEEPWPRVADRDLALLAKADILIGQGELSEAEAAVERLSGLKVRARSRIRVDLARDPRYGWTRLAGQVAAALHEPAPQVPASVGDDWAIATLRGWALARADRLPLAELSAVERALQVSGRWDEAAAFAERQWKRAGTPSSAVTVARSAAQRGSPDVALPWLQRALDAGISRASLAEDAGLEPLRRDPRVRELLDP